MALPSFKAERTRDLYSLLNLDAAWIDSHRKISIPTICDTEWLGSGLAG